MGRANAAATGESDSANSDQNQHCSAHSHSGSINRFKLGATFYSIVLLIALGTQIDLWANDFRQKTEAAWKKAREAYQSDPSPSNAVAFARLCFDAAEFSRNHTERESYARDGIGVGNRLAQEQPKMAAAHYYLAMNYGQLAVVKRMSALKLVDMIESSLLTAKSLDPNYDFAGPDRGLGLLYRDAPGWPISLGNKTKARTHLAAAGKLAPSYPDNLLNLLEAHVQWKERKVAREQLESITKQWPALKRQFTGEKWESAWADWDKRLAAAKRELD